MVKHIYCLVVFVLSFALNSFAQVIISGSVQDESSGENLGYATVHVRGTHFGSVTNDYGYYSFIIDQKKLDSSIVILEVSYIGYQTYIQKIDLSKSTEFKFNIPLSTDNTTLKEIEVIAVQSPQQQSVESTRMSTIKISASDLSKIPTFGGETDAIKVIQLLPGVTRGGEGNTGFFVRGGSADQNLVLLDEATVYDISHLFGFFSVFNPDAIKDLTMVKGAFPSNYGGRLSSILDIRMREGNNKKFHGQGGIGILSSRFTLEGPIQKGKSSFLISGRRTYIDKVVKWLNTGIQIPYHFYDLNFKANHIVNDKNRIFLSTYFGDDILRSDVDSSSFEFGFKLGNITNSIRWNHIYNQKTFSNISLIHTRYKYNIQGKFESNNIFINSKIRDIGVKADFNHIKDDRNNIKFGGGMINHSFRPNVVSTSGEISTFLKSQEGPLTQNQEVFLYALNDFDWKPGKLKINYGLRISGSVVPNKVYPGIEPRLALRYLTPKKNAFKLSYSKMRQYMHRVSSSSVSLPTDLWYPITEGIKPQSSDQIALGFHHFFKKTKTAFSIETYYKWMNNLIAFNQGTNLLLNNDLEKDLIQGKGYSYGVELLLKKDEGTRLTGWIGYTLSWSFRQFETLNQGKIFPAKYDRRHNISIVGNYKFTKRLSFSAVWTYISGSRFTAIEGYYAFPNPTLTGVELIPIYTAYNAVSLSPSHRLDVNLSLGTKKEKGFRGELQVGCYNLYNQTSPYRVTIEQNELDPTTFQYMQNGLFGFIPYLSYNFKF